MKFTMIPRIALSGMELDNGAGTDTGTGIEPGYLAIKQSRDATGIAARIDRLAQQGKIDELAPRHDDKVGAWELAISMAVNQESADVKAKIESILKSLAQGEKESDSSLDYKSIDWHKLFDRLEKEIAVAKALDGMPHNTHGTFVDTVGLRQDDIVAIMAALGTSDMRSVMEYLAGQIIKLHGNNPEDEARRYGDVTFALRAHYEKQGLDLINRLTRQNVETKFLEYYYAIDPAIAATLVNWPIVAVKVLECISNLPEDRAAAESWGFPNTKSESCRVGLDFIATAKDIMGLRKKLQIHDPSQKLKAKEVSLAHRVMSILDSPDNMNDGKGLIGEEILLRDFLFNSLRLTKEEINKFREIGALWDSSTG